MTWRDIFDTTHQWWGHMDTARQAAKVAGYKFFCWNDRVYDTSTGKDTGVLVEHVGQT